MNSQKALEIIETVGLKKYAVALAVGMHPVNFSEYLHNKRSLTVDQLNKIEAYLSKFDNAVE